MASCGSREMELFFQEKRRPCSVADIGGLTFRDDEALDRAAEIVPGKSHSAGSTAASYSCFNRAINSAAGRILPTLPTPWPLPQISFQAFGLARSPEASVPKLIFDASDCGRLSGSMPAATIDGLR